VTSRCYALIPAAGTGTRTGRATPKQYLPIAGLPMIVHTLVAFAAVPAIERIAVVVAPDDTTFEALELAPALKMKIDLVRAGGATRDASVANGLDAMRSRIDDDDWVLVHDAARCGITAVMIERLIEYLRDEAIGGLLAVTLDDTIKRQAPSTEDAVFCVAETVDRRGLWRAQTPQMFRYRLLRDALASARARGLAITDEASAVEAIGLRALLVTGSPRNFKVTTEDDLTMMELLLADAHVAMTRSDPTRKFKATPS
jgi:2-C-methyl-D-erythritol 4-phosphate cytidylyltransferase